MIILAALMIPLMAGIMFPGYQSSTQKKEEAQSKVQDARQDLNAAQKDTNAIGRKVATAKEWKTFNKRNFELKIGANERRIIKLNVKLNLENPQNYLMDFIRKRLLIWKKKTGS